MVGSRRFPAAVALIVCLVGTEWPAPVLASEPQPNATTSSGGLLVGEQTRRAMELSPATATAMNGSQNIGTSAFAQWGRYRGRGRRHNVAQAEMVLGAVATIAGAAVLTYANRPECSANARADGCSYGTKVVGASVAAAGLVTFVTGALTW
jgi:hypothetical protein